MRPYVLYRPGREWTATEQSSPPELIAEEGTRARRLNTHPTDLLYQPFLQTRLHIHARHPSSRELTARTGGVFFQDFGKHAPPTPSPWGMSGRELCPETRVWKLRHHLLLVCPHVMYVRVLRTEIRYVLTLTDLIQSDTPMQWFQKSQSCVDYPDDVL
jgi:hypothetical protein